MTTDKNIGPGADAVRHLLGPQLDETVAIYEEQVEQMPKGSEARRIIEALITAGQEEMQSRAGTDRPA